MAEIYAKPIRWMLWVAPLSIVIGAAIGAASYAPTGSDRWNQQHEVVSSCFAERLPAGAVGHGPDGGNGEEVESGDGFHYDSCRFDLRDGGTVTIPDGGPIIPWLYYGGWVLVVAGPLLLFVAFAPRNGEGATVKSVSG